MDAGGNLIGATYVGGSDSHGTIFKYSASKGPQTAGTFHGANGSGPNSTLAYADGYYYGLTTCGGTGYNGQWDRGSGTIFRYTAAGGIRTLASFRSTNGANPIGGLITTGTGNFYGTTEMGGSYSDGTLFKLTREASTPEAPTWVLMALGGVAAFGRGLHAQTGARRKHTRMGS